MRRPALGVLLAVLSAGFACAHLAWALGWRAGVPADQPPIATRPVFLTYDLLAMALMYAAAAVALVLGLRSRLRPRLVLATRIGAVLALLRGVPALVIDIVVAARGGDLTFVGTFADGWFVTAGALGLVLAGLADEPGSGAQGVVEDQRGHDTEAEERPAQA